MSAVPQEPPMSCACDEPRPADLTLRQAEVLALAVSGLSDRQIARRLGISRRTVEHHLAAVRARTGTRNRVELTRWAAGAGLIHDAGPASQVVEPGPPGPVFIDHSFSNEPVDRFRDGKRDDPAASRGGGTRLGYAGACARAEDQRAQLDALARAGCRRIVTETVAGGHPELCRALSLLRSGDTLVINRPDQIAWSVPELLSLLRDEVQPRGINLEILSGVCARLHCPNGAGVADRMLFLVAQLATEMDRAASAGECGEAGTSGRVRRCGRPSVLSRDKLAIARDRRERGESMTAIARDLGIGRSTLYRALESPA